MSVTRIVQQPASDEEIRSVLRQSPLGALRNILTDAHILAACRHCGHTFRRRRFDPVVTVLHFLAQALQRDHSFAATWQLLWTPLAAGFPELAFHTPATSALTHARTRLPQAVLQHLADQACARAADQATTTWRGLRLRALDASTLSMPRQKPLFDFFGAHRARTTTVRYPLATFACLLDLSTSLILDYRFAPFDPGEKKTALPLLRSLGDGDLLLADRGFAGSPFLARVSATGAHFLLRKNARLNPETLPVLQRLGPNDFITEVHVSRRARRDDPSLPERVRVRLFRATFRIPDGRKVTDWFVTSLEDPRRSPRKVLAGLYHRRWQQETSFLEFKGFFHGDVLRSKTVANVLKELHAHVLAYLLVRLVVVEAARTHELTPTEISVLAAARWVMSFSQQMARSPAWRLPLLYRQLLDAVATSVIDVRPGRLEPRALTREWKHYPHLRTTRSHWRSLQLHGAS